MATAPRALEFVVERGDLRRFTVLRAADPATIELPPGQVVLRVDKFGFSANNITYAMLGEAMRYWEFFPAREGWVKIPVWGYGDVVRSASDEIHVGERVFGYLPMSTHVVVQPEQVSERGFVDGLPHRADLPSVYQRYSSVAGDPRYEPEHEDMQALWRPLFMTSFGAVDYLGDNDLFGARAVVLSSASSKTALGVAFLLSRDCKSQREVIGLTSARNVAFCDRVGYYDRVLDYRDLGALTRETPTVFVDFAGDPKLLRQLRGHLGDRLRQACIIGATHWEQRQPGHDLAADAEFFFLPPWLEKRRREWGVGEFGRRYGDAWRAFLPSVNSWLQIVRGDGPTAVERVYRDLLEGRADPSVGHILSLAE